jgi:hypothetical protein
MKRFFFVTLLFLAVTMNARSGKSEYFESDLWAAHEEWEGEQVFELKQDYGNTAFCQEILAVFNDNFAKVRYLMKSGSMKLPEGVERCEPENLQRFLPLSPYGKFMQGRFVLWNNDHYYHLEDNCRLRVGVRGNWRNCRLLPKDTHAHEFTLRTLGGELGYLDIDIDADDKIERVYVNDRAGTVPHQALYVFDHPEKYTEGKPPGFGADFGVDFWYQEIYGQGKAQRYWELPISMRGVMQAVMTHDSRYYIVADTTWVTHGTTLIYAILPKNPAQESLIQRMQNKCLFERKNVSSQSQ